MHHTRVWMSFQTQAGPARVHGRERASAAQTLYHILLSSIVQTLKPADVCLGFNLPFCSKRPLRSALSLEKSCQRHNYVRIRFITTPVQNFGQSQETAHFNQGPRCRPNHNRGIKGYAVSRYTMAQKFNRWWRK
jgi:hypothetical protein